MKIKRIKDIEWYATITCCSCGSKVRLSTIKEQIKEKRWWSVLPSVDAVFCSYCTNNIEDNLLN